jgi:DNA polymerase-3 subunit delta
LFSEGRVIVLDSAHDISQELADAVLAYVKQPAEGVVLVVVHSGGGRSKAAKALPAALRKAGAEIAECLKLTKPAEREAFVRNEVRQAGGRIDPAAVAALVDAVGTDLRELASAAGQLVADAGGKVDEQAVRRYHRGRADVTGFAVAEKAVAGDRAAALESMRWAMQIGVPHVLVADALADAVRTIARVSAAGRGNPNQLAGELGMPPWKIRKAQGQVRGWAPAGLAAAMAIVARVNAEVKGAAADPSYALERAILELAAARDKR